MNTEIPLRAGDRVEVADTGDGIKWQWAGKSGTVFEVRNRYDGGYPVRVNIDGHTSMPIPFRFEELRKLEPPQDFQNFWGKSLAEAADEGEFVFPPRHPNSQRFHAILAEHGELHDKKQKDYGAGNDPFANVRASEGWGVAPWVGAMIRLNDKVERLKSFISNGELANEGVEDSLRDIAVYATIALVLFEEESDEH